MSFPFSVPVNSDGFQQGAGGMDVNSWLGGDKPFQTGSRTVGGILPVSGSSNKTNQTNNRRVVFPFNCRPFTQRNEFCKRWHREYFQQPLFCFVSQQEKTDREFKMKLEYSKTEGSKSIYKNERKVRGENPSQNGTPVSLVHLPALNYLLAEFCAKKGETVTIPHILEYIRFMGVGITPTYTSDNYPDGINVNAVQLSGVVSVANLWGEELRENMELYFIIRAKEVPRDGKAKFYFNAQKPDFVSAEVGFGPDVPYYFEVFPYCGFSPPSPEEYFFKIPGASSGSSSSTGSSPSRPSGPPSGVPGSSSRRMSVLSYKPVDSSDPASPTSTTRRLSTSSEPIAPVSLMSSRRRLSASSLTIPSSPPKKVDLLEQMLIDIPWDKAVAVLEYLPIRDVTFLQILRNMFTTELKYDELHDNDRRGLFMFMGLAKKITGLSPQKFKVWITNHLTEKRQNLPDLLLGLFFNDLPVSGSIITDTLYVATTKVLSKPEHKTVKDTLDKLSEEQGFIVGSTKPKVNAFLDVFASLKEPDAKWVQGYWWRVGRCREVRAQGGLPIQHHLLTSKPDVAHNYAHAVSQPTVEIFVDTLTAQNLPL